MNAERARRELVKGLQGAASGELAATLAYLGHRASLPFGADRETIRRILVDEIRHRRIVIAMLEEMGSATDPRRERKLSRIGRAISSFCAVGGWFLPMVGAARLECDNVIEYEVLARHAHEAGFARFVDSLLHLAEVEWDHEFRLRACASRHFLWRLVVRWPVPPPRESIRARFREFVAGSERHGPAT